MNDEILNVNNLSVALKLDAKPVTALSEISFNIAKGETFALVGESGCGKTMTALAINQLLPDSAYYTKQSEINFHQDNLLNYSEAKMQTVRGRRIAMIFQEPMTSLNPVLSVGQQIIEVLQLHTKLNKKQQQKRALELLDAVGIASAKQRMKEYPHQLSGGMKQRVMIAIALAIEPELLIADEPTTALDVTIQQQILELLQEIQRRQNMAILLITHDMATVKQIAHRVAVMYAGQIVEQASVDEILQNPKHPYTRRLLQVRPSYEMRAEQLPAIPGIVPNLLQTFSSCRFSDRCHRAWDLCQQQAPDLYSAADEHIARCFLYEPTEQRSSEPQAAQALQAVSPRENNQTAVALSAEQVRVHFPLRKGFLQRQVGAVKAVDGISFDLHAQRTLALIGESGCGKTTLGKAVVDLLKTTSGGFTYHQSNAKNLRSDIQIIFQDPFSSLNPRHTVRKLLAEGLRAQNLIKSRKDLDEKVSQLLDAVGLTQESEHRYPHQFSGGQRQRIGIARALAVNPKIIVCDEPTSALDLSVQAQILNLLCELQATQQLSYLFITHDISVVSYMADEVAVMYLGRIVEQGSVEDILHSPKHPYTQILLATMLDDDNAQRQVKGEQPSPSAPPQGCHFHPRCPHAMPECKKDYPAASSFSEKHWVKCFLYDKN